MKIKAKEDNIETMYNMVPYKLKVIHAEDDILNFSPIILNRNANPKFKNFSDESSMVPIDD